MKIEVLNIKLQMKSNLKKRAPGNSLRKLIDFLNAYQSLVRYICWELYDTNNLRKLIDFLNAYRQSDGCPTFGNCTTRPRKRQRRLRGPFSQVGRSTLEIDVLLKTENLIKSNVIVLEYFHTCDTYFFLIYNIFLPMYSLCNCAYGFTHKLQQLKFSSICLIT